MQGHYIKVKCLHFNKDIVNQEQKKYSNDRETFSFINSIRCLTFHLLTEKLSAVFYVTEEAIT